MSEHKHVFSSAGLTCSATLFLPEQKSPPVILLAQGFGAEWRFGTSGFISAFLNAGFAVFAFDYRSFGESEGSPRQLVHPERHCEDWNAALQYLRSLEEVDNQRIFLWGSSFAGGHVLVTAANNPGLKGVISQVPFTTSRSQLKTSSLGKMVLSIAHGLLDLALSLIGKEHRVALLAEPGEGFAVMNWAGWHRDYLKISHESTTWTNSMPARALLTLSNYNPVDTAAQIKCPVLIISGSNDMGILSEDVAATAGKIPLCKHVELELDHFDLYDGFPQHETAVQLQLDFLHNVLETL